MLWMQLRGAALVEREDLKCCLWQGTSRRDRVPSLQCPQRRMHSTSKQLECTVHNAVAVADDFVNRKRV